MLLVITAAVLALMPIMPFAWLYELLGQPLDGFFEIISEYWIF